MPTKTFSSRAEESSLSFADALTRKEYGLSFGQYCGTVLIDSITSTGKMPVLDAPAPQDGKRRAAAFIKGFSAVAHDASIGCLSDEGVRELIAERYA